MADKRYLNIWSSLIVYCNEKIAQFRAEYPEVPFSLIDWESSNVNELPDGDLIGPASLTVMEQETGILSATFAIGVSSHRADTNLFRHRDMVSSVFEDLTPERKVAYYDTQLNEQRSVLVMTGGTLLAPMTKMDVRPWQYVQAEALLVPQGASA